jgi:chromate transporter
MWRRPLEILYRFALLGISCFGGPTAHIGVFHTTFVKSLKWVTAEEFAHDNTLCQLIPGPASSQLGMLIGARRGGIIGSLCAWVGFTTPSAVLMYLAATNLPWMSAQSSAGAGLLVGAAVTVCAAVWGMINPIRTSRPALLLCCLSGLALLISPNSSSLLSVHWLQRSIPRLRPPYRRHTLWCNYLRMAVGFWSWLDCCSS